VRRSSAPRSGTVIELALGLIQGDPHQWSARPCPTCRGRHVDRGRAARGPLSSALRWNLYRRALFSPKIARHSGYPTKLTEPRLGCSPPGRC